MANNGSQIASFIWDLADLLRGDYKRNEYRYVILPFTVLKRFDSVLSDTKKNVLDTHKKYRDKFDDLEKVLKSASKQSFYNYSRYDFSTLLEDPDSIEENLNHYIDSFSINVQDIFKQFDIKNQIKKLAEKQLLFLLIKKFNDSSLDLHPNKVSNYDMGTIFEELVRKFNELSNEEAGDHYTPREIVELMTHLMFETSRDEISKKNVIKTVYDPACGTGGMLTGSKNYIASINSDIEIVLFGQELNEETYAICKADMLIKGEDADKIKGPFSTLSDDKFPENKFDFIISNPPYGMKWEKDKEEVLKELENEEGRFVDKPSISDGQLLFLQHMISKMKVNGEKSRVAAITNGSPLFTGDAGQGETEIRKWMIENDYIEAIIALPDQLFYNTGIFTYVWILTNDKSPKRVGKIQLINGTSFYQKMRKSLGDKRHELSPKHIDTLVQLYQDNKKGKLCKIFDNEDFAYTKVIVERPMQLNYSASKERLENLYSVSQFAKLAQSKKEDIEKKLAEEEEGKKLQEKMVVSLGQIGGKVYTSWDEFEPQVKKALKDFKITPTFIKNVILGLSEHDDKAEYVTDIKGKKKANTNLRDSEKILLKEDIEEYFQREVISYYSDAWMDRKKDKIGYEINFNKYFYEYKPPRSLEEIEKDISELKKYYDKKYSKSY